MYGRCLVPDTVAYAAYCRLETSLDRLVHLILLTIVIINKNNIINFRNLLMLFVITNIHNNYHHSAYSLFTFAEGKSNYI